MDRIYIVDLSARCIIGLNPEERTNKQDVILNIAIETDLTRAGKSDDVKDTIDYKGLKKRILALVEDSQYKLIESLAQRVASVCLDNPRATGVQVRVDKPGALRFARSVAAEIYRTR